MPHVSLLPQNLINQIAAGEVVERPASVIKELVENSLDAGATQIEVHLQRAGRELLRITDNGCGMTPDDARLAVMRHATSKIHSFEDLLRVGTMGFRGEALPSIASISYFTLRTKPFINTTNKGTTITRGEKVKEGKVEESEGFEIRIEGGTTTHEAPCAFSGLSSGSRNTSGTQITVEHLFYNVPARRKFLKSDATELAQGVETMKAIALANLTTGFTLFDGKRVIFELPAGQTLSARLQKLFGEEAVDGLLEIGTGNNAHEVPPAPFNALRSTSEQSWAPAAGSAGATDVPSDISINILHNPSSALPVKSTATGSYLECNPQGVERSKDCVSSEEIQGYARGPINTEGLQENKETTLRGFLSPIGKTFSTRAKILFFVNRRCVDSKIFHQALRMVYGATMTRGHYPAAFLFLEIPATEIDVNVHPAKREIRFRSEREVLMFLVKSLSQALSLNPGQFSPQTPFAQNSSDFNSNLGSTAQTANGLPHFAFTSPTIFAPPAWTPETSAIPFPSNTSASNPASTLNSPLSTFPSSPRPPLPAAPPTQTFMRVAEAPSTRHGWSFLAFLHADYALFSTPDSLCLVSLSNAQERVAYEKIEASFNAQTPSQALLIPALLTLDSTLQETLHENSALLTRLGFIVAPFGQNCFRLEAIPAWLTPENGFGGAPESSFLEELAALSDESSTRGDERLKEQHTAQLAAQASRSTVRHAEAALKLLDALLLCKNPLKTPSGKPTLWQISQEELEKRFG